MLRRFLQIITLAVLLLCLGSFSTRAALDLSLAERAANNKIVQGIRQAPKDVYEAVHGFGEGSGTGFYMSIYESVVSQPNTAVENRIKERFGISSFSLDIAPASGSGPQIFTDFFKVGASSLFSPVKRYQPNLFGSLQQDCRRIKAAQISDTERQWDLVSARVQEQIDELNKKIITGKASDVEKKKMENLKASRANIEAVKVASMVLLTQQVSKKVNLDQQALLTCYVEFSHDIDFEIQLQKLLHPHSVQLEAMQTFTNGKLDDFTRSGGELNPTDINLGYVFPRYDLLLDLQAIDTLIFGSPLVIDRPDSVAPAGTPGAKKKTFSNYPELAQAVMENQKSVESIVGKPLPNLINPNSNLQPVVSPQPDSSGKVLFKVAPGSGIESIPPSSGFGSGIGAIVIAGPTCPVTNRSGLSLDYSTVGKAPGTVATVSPAFDEVQYVRKLTGNEPALVSSRDTTLPNTNIFAPPLLTPGRPLSEVDQHIAKDIDQLKARGQFSVGKNEKAACQGASGLNLSNDFLDLSLCLDFKMSKTGKTWKSVNDDTCLQCQIAKMNQVFEDKVLKKSVRPHKNTGTIMESGLCEDATSSNMNWGGLIEWVPVKLFDDLCYPKAGVSQEDYAKLVGYPEIVSKIDQSDKEIICRGDFIDPDAIARCSKAISGPKMSYEQFKMYYLKGLDWLVKLQKGNQNAHGIEQPEDADKEKNTWARLVGDRGIVERELHVLLYRLGKVPAQFEEDKNIQQDFKKRLDGLRAKLKTIQDLPESEDKIQQFLCLKGYFYGEQQQAGGVKAFDCAGFSETFKKLDDDVNAERTRIGKMLKRWNQMSADFDRDHACSVFDSMSFKRLEQGIVNRFSSDFYLDTNTGRKEAPEDQFLKQISVNRGIDDLSQLFSEVDKSISTVKDVNDQKIKAQQVTNDQQVVLQFAQIRDEFKQFQTNLGSLTDAWGKMIQTDSFVSKSGGRISILESFLEKIK